MKKWLWFIVVGLVIVLDQTSKHWAVATLQPYQPNAVMPLLNVTLAYNTGAAFSFLSGAGEWHCWFFTVFSSMMSLLLIVWMVRTPKQDYVQLGGISFILAGALGNLIDRISLGHVIDFIDVYYAHYHWPVFNVADSAICIGAILLGIDVFFHKTAK
jgi:signal peptidase II